MEINEILSRLQALLSNPPELDGLLSAEPDAEHWVAKADAILAVVSQQFTYDITGIVEFRSAAKSLRIHLTKSTRAHAKQIIFSLLRRNMERLKLMVPSGSNGAFVPVGSEFEAYAEISRIAGEARSELLIVDPYMDDKILTEFFAGITGKKICLLSDQSTVKDELKVAAAKWRSQYSTQRPLEVRLTPPRVLHDRLIVTDGLHVWSITQSFKDFARRSPGSILKVEPETAKLKIEAYLKIWSDATPQ
jgi:hypothetical protein